MRFACSNLRPSARKLRRANISGLITKSVTVAEAALAKSFVTKNCPSGQSLNDPTIPTQSCGPELPSVGQAVRSSQSLHDAEVTLTDAASQVSSVIQTNYAAFDSYKLVEADADAYLVEFPVTRFGVSQFGSLSVARNSRGCRHPYGLNCLVISLLMQ